MSFKPLKFLEIKNKGVFYAFLAMISAATAGFFYARTFSLDPQLNPLFVGFIRILFGFLPAFILILRRRSLSVIRTTDHKNLILWGICGAATITTYFYSVRLVGVGLTQFLGAIQSLVILIATWGVLHHNVKRDRLLSVIMSLTGILFILNPFKAVSGFSTSLLPGIGSGVCAGFAYFWLSKCKSKIRFEVVSLYWAIPSFLAQLILITESSFHITLNFNFPSTIWSGVIAGGFLTALAQIFFSLAIQEGDAFLASLVGYVGAILNVIFDWSLGLIQLSHTLIYGIVLIFLGSVVFPYLQHNRIRVQNLFFSKN